ncbi:hypothetical protein [Streptosporangium sp. NPDC002721]|uniref:hypothetical protein n=1 Tax=Streptosporangium sp. NPDC002721 TaxID=3366188 RepID=UPI003698D2E9
MNDTPEVSEDRTERDTPEKDPPPAGPRGVDGETRVVAERSGSDTTFPERPLLADPDDARRTPEEESPEGAGHAEEEAEAEAGAGDGAEDVEESEKGTSGNGTPEPEVGPAS